MKSKNVRNVYVFLIIAAIAVFSCKDRGVDKDASKSLKKAVTVVAGQIIGAMSADEKVEESALRMPEGQTTWAALRGGDMVNSGDRIAVAANSTAMIDLKGGSRVALNSNTALKILSPSAVHLEKGDIWVEDNSGETDTEVAISTDVGKVAMKGALLGLRYNEGKLVTSVVSGNATIQGGLKEVMLHGGQEAVTDSGGIRVVHVKDPGGLVSWSRGLRDAMEKSSRNLEQPGSTVSSGLGTLSAKAPGTGTPLPFEVLSQDVTVRIQDQVALTRVEQTFLNPTNRVVEGTYKFPLPSGAKLTRYDMEIGGKLMRGEIVERDRGRKIMKTVIRQFVDMMRDPALTEWESGSTFKTRIFPIKAKEKKRIVLSYIQTLEGSGGKYHYVLPVSPAGAKAEKIPVFRIDAQVAGSTGTPIISTPLYPTETKLEENRAKVNFEANDFEPMVDFVIQIDKQVSSEATMATYGKGEDQDYFMVNLAPTIEDVEAQGTDGTDWILLADTSQSRNILDMELEKRLAATIVNALGPMDRVKVMAFDMNPRLMNNEFEVASQKLCDQTLSFFDSITPAGATNMAAALEEAARHLQDGRPSRVIVIGDGAATLGENRPGELSKMAARLFNHKDASVSAIGVGSSVDSLLFEEISRRTGGRYHYLSSGEDLLAAAVRIVTGLRVPVLENPTVTFDGLLVSDVHPRMLPNLGSGEEVSITGRYRGAGELIATLSGRLGGKDWSREYKFNVGEAKAENTFIPLMYASRKIDALTLEGGDRAKKETIRLSKKYSLPSRHTSFIVLENQAMYREFNVARRGNRFEWEGSKNIEYEGLMGEGMEEEDLDDVFAKVGGVGIGGGGTGSGRSASMGAGGGSVTRKAAARPKPQASGMMDLAELSGIDIDGNYHPPPCRRGFDYYVTVWGTPSKPKDKDRDKIAELRTLIQNEPLARKHRKNLVKTLLRFGRYQEARLEVAKWREMDGANPIVLKYTADLMRIFGDIDGALRIYSGVLDVKPEDKKTMTMLASYLESKNRQVEAYPFRVSLNLVKPKDRKYAARRAIAAANIEKWDDASRVTLELVEQGRDGSPQLKKGVRLPKGLKEAIFRVAYREKPSLLFEAASRADAKSAKFRFEIEWNADVDLDLWVSNRSNRFLGGGGTDARLVEGGVRGESEILYMKDAGQGSYKIQVICAESSGCGNVAGKLHIRAPGNRRTIPFVLENGFGTDVATVYVERWRRQCGW